MTGKTLPPDPPSRIEKVRPEQVTEEIRGIYRLFAGGLNVESNHVLNTFAKHPQLASAFLAFNGYLLKSTTLPVRLRQLAIMRTAWLCRGLYVWSSHLQTSQRNGLSSDIFAPLQEGSTSPFWNADERTVLQATEQLLACGDLDDDHWQALAEVLDEKQRLDFLFTVGTYQALSQVGNALRIDREEPLRELAARHGAPVSAHDS